LDKLSSIPASVGKATHYEEDESNQSIIFKILPSPKLTIPKPAYFKVVLPTSWPVKPPTVTFLQGEVPPGSIALALNQPVKCLLLDEVEGWSRTYNLSIIYYTLRDLFKKSNNGVPDDMKWDLASTPWLPVLPTDLPSGKHYGFIAGHAGGQGRRRTMEDCVIIKQGVNLTKHYTNSAALFGIFDGHAGDTCVKFVEATFPQVLIEELNKNTDYREAIGSTFLKTDELFLSNEELANSKSGCTACAVVFDGSDRLFAANLGDCRAVLCRANGTALEVTVHLKPKLYISHIPHIYRFIVLYF
jgi:ubiquitin-protein ligase